MDGYRKLLYIVLPKIKRNGGFDFSKLLRKSKNDKQQF